MQIEIFYYEKSTLAKHYYIDNFMSIYRKKMLRGNWTVDIKDFKKMIILKCLCING